MTFWGCTVVGEREAGVFLDQFLPSDDHPHCMGALPQGGSQGEGQTQGGLMVAEPKTKTKRPPMYKVILLNDDYTPMDFVVMVLEQIFRKNHADALNVMLEVHQKGAGIAGVYTRDVAETKLEQAVEYARINDYPLQCALESE